MINFVKAHSFLILLFLITIFGSLPRAIELLSGNYLFGFDQGLFYEAVYKIVVLHQPTLIGAEVGGIGGFFQGPGWYYLLSFFFIAFNGDPYGAMVLMFLLGVLSIVLAGLLFYKQNGIVFALIFSFLIAFSPGIISQSRFFWPPFVITPLTILFIFAIQSTYSHKKYYLPLAFFLLGIMTHFEIATGGSLLLSTIITLFFVRPKNVISARIIGITFIAFFVTQLPIVLFDLRHNFIGTKGLLKFLTIGSSTHTTYSFSNHIDMYKDVLLIVTGNWQLALLCLALIVYSTLRILRKKTKTQEKKIILFIILCPTVLFMLFIPLKATLWSWWFLELPVFLCFLLSSSFIYAFRQKKIKIFAFLILLLLFISSSYQTYSWYKNDFLDYGGTAKIRGKIDAIDYIFKDAKRKNFGLLVFSPPVYTYPYDYLIKWYAAKKYNFYPKQKITNEFYLLIEPDPEKPWSYKGWIDTVIKKGKVVKTITLPSGFIIQKRITE